MTIAVPPELLPDGAKGLVLDCDGTLMVGHTVALSVLRLSGVSEHV